MEIVLIALENRDTELNSRHFPKNDRSLRVNQEGDIELSPRKAPHPQQDWYVFAVTFLPILLAKFPAGGA